MRPSLLLQIEILCDTFTEKMDFCKATNSGSFQIHADRKKVRNIPSVYPQRDLLNDRGPRYRSARRSAKLYRARSRLYLGCIEAKFCKKIAELFKILI